MVTKTYKHYWDEQCKLLLEAAANGDRSLLDDILEGKHGRVGRDEINDAVYQACIYGNKHILQRLIDHGADPNMKDVDGDSALMQATANGHIGCVKLLLDKGSNVNQASIRGRCALHLAVWHNHLLIVSMLLAKGCDTSLRECYGDTPLIMCAQRGFPEVMTELLKAGADTLAVNDDRDTALHLACRFGHTECALLLCKAIPFLDVTNMWGITPLFCCIMYGHTETAKRVVQAGASTHALDRHDKTLLHHAVDKELIECVELLLDNGVSPDWVCGEKNTALSIAVKKNCLQIARLLIQANCDVNISSRMFIHNKLAMFHPLEAALRLGHGYMARLLVQAGTSLEPLRSLYVVGEIHEDLVNDDDFMFWVNSTLAFPRKLLLLCRMAILKRLSNAIATDVRMLPLPVILQNFLSYRDVLTE
eukprot:GHVU01179146.1.p1 GENE.GHVU01179146.1~~GHVU01179146.1.p1  ORF type:complete len:420 (+),score=28.48 GHVU01179146.1:113-1372(+)